MPGDADLWAIYIVLSAAALVFFGRATLGAAVLVAHPRLDGVPAILSGMAVDRIPVGRRARVVNALVTAALAVSFVSLVPFMALLSLSGPTSAATAQVRVCGVTVVSLAIAWTVWLIRFTRTRQGLPVPLRAEADEVRDGIRSRRDCDAIWVVIRERINPDPTQDASLLAEEVGLRATRSTWLAVGRPRAEAIAQWLIGTDLADAHAWMSPADAARLTAGFTSRFDPQASFLSNLGAPADLRSRNPVSEYAFDAAIVTFDEQKIGMICIAAEG